MSDTRDSKLLSLRVTVSYGTGSRWRFVVIKTQKRRRGNRPMSLCSGCNYGKISLDAKRGSRLMSFKECVELNI